MSSYDKTGGPAYPFVEWRSPDGMVAITSDPGMSLRDYFAAQALHRSDPEYWPNASDLAAWAYEVADAMIRARNHPKGA